jgi:Flp pilus assembly protein TadG
MTKLTKSFAQLAGRAARDPSGTISVMAAMSLTALIGFAGLGTEVSYWYVQKRDMQSAADSASFSAMAAVKAGETITSGAPASGTPVDAAKATAAQYGFVDGTNGVTVTVNNPPASGPNSSNNNAVEVIITQPQQRLFSSFFMSSNPTIGGRAVSALNGGGTPCVLALNDGNVTDLTVSGNPTLNIPGCDLYVNSSNAGSALNLGGNATINANSTHVVGGINYNGGGTLNDSHGTFDYTGSPVADPFANASFSMPSGCDYSSYSGTPATLTPANQSNHPGSIVICGGFTVNNNTNVTLNPGVYYIDGGSFKINGGSLTGTGVTIVLTGSGSDYATVTINGNSTVNLNNCDPNNPCAGPIKGLAFFQDRNAPPSAPVGNGNLFNGGSTMNINGGIYFPNQRVTYTGGAETGGSQCTQLVANTIKVTGETNFQGNCSAITGVTDGSGQSIALVE